MHAGVYDNNCRRLHSYENCTYDVRNKAVATDTVEILGDADEQVGRRIET
jgi:hypothetical protein